jgi:hypothetical protein
MTTQTTGPVGALRVGWGSRAIVGIGLRFDRRAREVLVDRRADRDRRVVADRDAEVTTAADHARRVVRLLFLRDRRSERTYE